MEEKINIAAILKDKPNGLRLYSPIFGECKFCYVREETNDICVKKYNGEKDLFDSKGLYYNTGEVMLFPSKEMRDWSKFFKKGDVLFYIDGKCKVIFDKFDDDKYTSFIGKHYLESYGKDGELQDYEEIHCGSTVKYTKESEEAAQTYINTIEERLGGKLNIETLEIEKPEFKDGNILYVKTKKLGLEYIIINKLSEEAKTTFYVAYNLSSKIFWNLTYFVCCDKEISILRQATDYEKSQLFDTLSKKGKAWDSEKKEVVDLKPKWITLKPFDKVLVRDGKDEIWEPAFFFRNRPELSIYKYQTVGGKLRVYCIPYNEETAELIGTTKEWK